MYWFLRLDKIEKAAINLQNKDGKCFQHTASVALNYGETELHPERVLNIKPFINKCNWEGINYSWKIDDWENIWEKYSNNCS